MDKKKSFVLYTDYRDQLALIPDDEKGRLLMALMDYAADGAPPENLSAAGLMCFAFIKQSMDRDAEKYANVCKTRAIAGAMGGRPRKEKEAEKDEDTVKTEGEDSDKQTKAKKPNAFFVKQNNPDNDNDSDNDNDIKKKKAKEKKRFAPPILTEVQEYCQEKALNVDAERFIDFYSSKGWIVGKTPMRDWRAAARNWSRSQRQELTTKTPTKNRFHNLEQHGYDYDKMVWGMINDATQGETDPCCHAVN